MEQDIYEALAEFRREFWRCSFFGLKFAGKLPPLSATHAARLEREAVAYYETGFHPTASLEAARNLRRETMAAIKTARLYGSRSHRNQKLLDGVRKAVEESTPC